MASTTPINVWMDELVLSLFPPSIKFADARKHKENFIRKIKHHPYGRTNQFAVVEKLTGLEEKFQVLNLDDVAAELYSRRRELNNYHQKWLPDILDLLLHLSHDPVRNSRVENLEKLRHRAQTPPPLKWADIEADDPINRRDGIWNIPDYSDYSSDEDEVAISTTYASPASTKQDSGAGVEVERIFDTYDTLEESPSSAPKLKSAQFWRGTKQLEAITERQAIREVLFMVAGLPTSLFVSSDGGIRPNPRYRLNHLEISSSQSLLKEAAQIGTAINAVRQWLQLPRHSSTMQLVQSGISDILSDFEQGISRMQCHILLELSPTGVISLLQTLRTLEAESLPLNALGTITAKLAHSDPIASLNTIYSSIETAFSFCNSITVQTLLPIFLSALGSYAKPIDIWLHTGRIETTETFFISENNKQPRNASTLWHDWFILASERENLIPAFLRNFANRIFTAGKTAAFLHHLGRAPFRDQDQDLGIAAAAIEAAQMLSTSSSIPFSATFEAIVDRHLTSLLTSSTAKLKSILETTCGLITLLNAFDYFYLATDGFILDNIELRMFEQIDRCMEMWNDRFLLADLLAEAYQEVECVLPDCITIRSAYTSSRSMEARRRSVKILGAVSFSYHLTWPLANIILPSSILAYQRIALTLMQIRRAKSILKRRAYFHVTNIPLGKGPSDQKVAQVLHWQLSHFVNVFYAHLTTCTIQPLTASMRERLQASSTGSLDEMIRIHGTYISSLEHACLSSQRIKPLRDALLTILDLCIRFTDLVTSPATAPARRESADGDFEASSFISARSQKRRRRATANDDSSSEDGEEEGTGWGEGYSTFILDEDSSVIQEIEKIGDSFAKHVSFLVAGLRAVARSSGEQGLGEGFEMLADGLEGVFPRKRSLF